MIMQIFNRSQLAYHHPHGIFYSAIYAFDAVDALAGEWCIGIHEVVWLPKCHWPTSTNVLDELAITEEVLVMLECAVGMGVPTTSGEIPGQCWKQAFFQSHRKHEIVEAPPAHDPSTHVMEQCAVIPAAFQQIAQIVIKSRG